MSNPPVSEIKIPANDYSPLCTLTMPLPAAGQFAGGCYQQGTGHRVLLSQAGQDESDKDRSISISIVVLSTHAN